MNNSTFDQTLPFLICGGGIAGFTLAKALQLQGAKVIVFERDENLECRPQGYSLTIQQGRKILNLIGVSEPIYKLESRCSKYISMSSDGKVLFTNNFSKKKRDDQFIPIPREMLRKILYESLDKDTVQWGKQVVDFKMEQDFVTLEFKDETKFKGCCVVACDGIRSLFRDFLVGDPLKYLNVVAINGIVPIQHKLTTDTEFQTVDGVSRLFTKPFMDDKTMWQITFPMEEEKIKEIKSFEEAKEIVQERVKDWHSPVPEMIKNTEPSTMRVGGLYDRDPIEKPWKTTLITLLGDSAHPMSPFKGQGANNALDDGSSLMDCLKNSKSIPEAFETYEKLMIERSKIHILKSRNGVEFLHTKDVFDQIKIKEYRNFTGK
jgi:salicylate hydroxylase